MTVVPTIKLNDGSQMPILGLGTYMGKSNEVEEAVKYAIDVGYRHIDTAFVYQNEIEVGNAIKTKINEGVVKREDIYLVTKLASIHHEPSLVEHACKKSLDQLGLSYIDLYLIHYPVGVDFVDDETLMPKNDKGELLFNEIDYVDTWKAMEELVKKGWVKSIGLSNFNSEQTKRILDICTIKPVTNQVECHVELNQKKLIKFSKQHDIVITAYCPLARPQLEEKKPAFLFDSKFTAIAEKHKKTPAQIALRYLIQIGTVPIPKSVTKSRIAENINVFDFELSSEDMRTLDTFYTGERIGKFTFSENHKYFPFKLEY